MPKFRAPKDATGITTSDGVQYMADDNGVIEVAKDAPSYHALQIAANGFELIADGAAAPKQPDKPADQPKQP